MARFLLRRLAASSLLILLILSFTFFFIHLAPGDPTAVFDDPRISRQHQEELRRAYGLDRPLPARFVTWIAAVTLEFDWGVSFSHNRPVGQVIRQYLPATLILTATALAIQFGAGLAVGVSAARRAGSRYDHALRLGSLVLYSLPPFWLALMSILLWSHTVPLFPPGQMRSVGALEMPLLGRLADLAHHLTLPAMVLGLATAGGVARFARASLLEVLRQDYIRTARAKGLAAGKVVWVHALRNALAPLVQILGLSLPFLLSGALVVEVVFAWPGMGRMTHQAILARDYPLILAGTAISAVLVVAGNLAADLLQAVIDPRVRHGR